MKQIWVNIADSYKQAEDFDMKYYGLLSPQERLEIVQFLRESYLKIDRRLKDADRKRLRRIVKIVQQK